MKKITLLLMLTLVACTQSVKTPQKTDDNCRFEIIYMQNDFDSGIEIIRDKKTNVEYLVVKESYGAGLTKLEK